MKIRYGITAVIILCLSAFAVTTASAIEEDDPGWDCHTMGNLICGTANTFENPDGWAPDVCPHVDYDGVNPPVWESEPTGDCVGESNYCARVGGLWDNENRACITWEDVPLTTERNLDYTPDVQINVAPSVKVTPEFTG